MPIDKSLSTTFKVGRGKVGGYSFAVWDYVGECQGEGCPLFKKCTYRKDPESTRTKCGIEGYYLRKVFEPFSDLIDGLKDPFLMQWIGLHMIPLYHQLVKLKKVERSLDNPVTYNHKDEVRIHPIYREIRSVIKAIRLEWRNSGLMDIAKDEGYLGRLPSPLAGGEDDDPLDGDPEFHTRLSEGFTDGTEYDEEDE